MPGRMETESPSLLRVNSPTTMIVKCAPRLATILCLYNARQRVSATATTSQSRIERTWLGRLAIPMPSVVGGEVVSDILNYERDGVAARRRRAKTTTTATATTGTATKGLFRPKSFHPHSGSIWPSLLGGEQGVRTPIAPLFAFYHRRSW